MYTAITIVLFIIVHNSTTAAGCHMGSSGISMTTSSVGMAPYFYFKKVICIMIKMYDHLISTQFIFQNFKIEPHINQPS